MSKYNPENLSVRSLSVMRDNMVNHPDNADRREKVELLIDWRLARERHLNESGIAKLAAFERIMAREKSQGARALTVLAEREGKDRVFISRTSIEMMADFIASTEIVVDVERLRDIAKYSIEYTLPVTSPIVSDLGTLFGERVEPETVSAYIERHYVRANCPSDIKPLLH